MSGSALLWRGGHYNFGNADQSSLANQNNLGNEVLEREQQRQARIQSNEHTNNDNVHIEGENELLTQKRKRRPPYDVDNFLLKENGLDAIHKHFGDIKFKGKGNEIRDLKKLMENYKEWAFIMYPSMNFKDIIKKTEQFSSKNSVKSYLQRLRDKRDGFDIIMEEEEEEEKKENKENENKENEDEDEDIDLIMNDNRNNPIRRQLERRADNDFEAVIAARANRDNDGGNIDDNNNNDNNMDNNVNGNNNNNGNDNNDNNRNNMDNLWGDPFDDMMNSGMPNDFDIEIANSMYG